MSADPFSQNVDGFQISGMFSAENFRSATNYKPRPDDIFLVTYPKCGTTWTRHILVLLLQKGEPFQPSDLHSRAPFLEMTGAEFVKKMVRPGPIKTHMPFHLTPWSKDAKYIYVTRNPKDCCVSYFHHMRNIPGHNFNGTFDQFFELFISGKIDFGDYFDHLLSWHPHRNDPNVLFLTYEELHENIDAAIMKMASFLDDKKYAEPIRRNPKILESIKKYSSLRETKEFMTNVYTKLAEMTPEEKEKSPFPKLTKEILITQKENFKAALKRKESWPMVTHFVRKGIIGDWRSHFLEDQSRRMDEKFADRTQGTGIANLWKQCMQ